MTVHGASGWGDAWFRLIATRPLGGSCSASRAHGWSNRLWNVLTTGTGSTWARRRFHHSRWEWTIAKSSARSITSRIVAMKYGPGSPPKPIVGIAIGTVSTWRPRAVESPLANVVT